MSFKIFVKSRKAAASRELFIKSALQQAGYTSKANRVSYFGEQVGYSGANIPWDGAFIDVIAKDSDIFIHSHVYTPAALAEYVRTNRFRTVPKRGDIVFFTFSAEPSMSFSAPHVGIVLDEKFWASHGKLLTLEAQVSSGLPRASELSDGVYKRVRYMSDVLGFGRPDFSRNRIKKSNEETGRTFQFVSTSKVSELSLKYSKNPALVKPALDVEIVQWALAARVGATGFDRGVWCPVTKSAFQRYQRVLGLVGSDVTGVPTAFQLEILGRETELFTTALVKS
jgi:hypothetical protein